VPQVYYVGLLAGTNDMALLQKTGVGRDINRQRFSLADIQTAVQKPVVQRLLELIQLRNSHPAFGGQFSVVPAGDGVAGTADQHLVLRWQQGSHVAELHADLALGRGHLETTQAGQVQVMQLG
jgi:sucrose phosphorylase